MPHHRHKHRFLALSAASLGGLALGLAGCEAESDEPAENVEEAAEELGDSVEDAAEDAGDAIEDATDG